MRRQVTTIALKLSGPVILASTILVLSCCGDKPSEPDKQSDTTPPTVAMVSPADGDSLVPLLEPVIVTFSEPMASASLVAALSFDPAVAGTFSTSDTTLEFTHFAGFEAGLDYTATLSASVTDEAGNALASAYSWTFRAFIDTIAPTIVSTSPAHGDQNATGNSPVSVTFSENIDLSTVNAAFFITPAASGDRGGSGATATFTPSTPLVTGQWYTARITTAITDTSGNHLAVDSSWDFYVVPDLVDPTASVVLPHDSAVVGDAVEIVVAAADNDVIDLVEFYIDGVHIAEADATSPPYLYTWDVSGEAVASEHKLVARAYDRAGNSVISDTVTVFYQWRPLASDPNEPIARNIEAIWTRSSKTEIEFRVKTYNGWGDYTDTIGGLDVAFYYDTDQNPLTGDTETSGQPINDIGADFNTIIGLHGAGFYAEDIFLYWDGVDWVAEWVISNITIASDTNIFEFGLDLPKLDDPEVFDLVVANVNTDLGEGNYYWDWVPDAGNGHLTVTVDKSWVSPPPVSGRASQAPVAASSATTMNNPFD